MIKYSKNLVFFAVIVFVLVFSIQISLASSSKTRPAKNKTVWLIPDIHCDEKAQLAISHTLQKLAERSSSQKPLLILMEGADGFVATNFFETFPRQKIRQTQTLHLVKNGILSGAEYLKIKEGAGFPILLEGIEDGRLYAKNFRQLRSIVQKRRFLSPWFRTFRKKLVELKKKIYSPKLQKLEKISLRLEKSQINISDYFREMSQFAPPTPDSSDFPKLPFQISLFLKLQTKEKLFSHARLNHEIQRLLINLSKTGQQDKLRVFYQKLVLYRLGKTSEQNYSDHLKKIYLGISEDQKTNYPTIGEFLNIMRLKNRLNIDALRKEIQSYSETLKKSLLSGDSEEKLYDLARDFSLLDKTTHLEAHREEFEAVQAHPEKLFPEKLTVRLKFLLKKAGLKEEYSETSSVIPHVKRLYRNSIAFYVTALKRETALVQNILRRLDQYESNFAVIIVGGFHCSGLEKILKLHSTRTKTVIPLISSPSRENHYFDLMLSPRLGRSMLSFPRLFSRLMARIGPEFQSDVLHELLVSYIEALQKETAEADMILEVEKWLTNFDRDLPEDFMSKSDFLAQQLAALSKNIAASRGSHPLPSQIILNLVQSHLKAWSQIRKDWAQIAKQEELAPEPPSWFKYFAADADVYSALLGFAGRYAKYKQDVRLSNAFDKDPLYIVSKALQANRPLFMKLLRMASHKKFEAYYVIEQLPFLVSVLGDDPENYPLLIELAEKIYTGDFVSSFTFQQMIAKPYFKKADIQLAIELADKGLDPAPLFATIDENFRVKRPTNAQDLEILKDQFLDMLYRIHENTGSVEENQLILESTLLSLYLADPAEVAKAFKLEGPQLELWENLGILFPYRDILENHPFLDFLKYLPAAHMHRIFTIVLAPKLSAPSNYSGVIYLPMNLSELEGKDINTEFADLINEIAQSLFENMEDARLKLWHDIQKMRDYVENPKTADPEQVEFTSFRDFSRMYWNWFFDPDSLILRANRDTIFRVHLEMMAEYFIIHGDEGQKYLRFYVPQYDTDEDGEAILLKQTMGIKTPYLGLTPVDIAIEHEAGPFWPVILTAYRELMDDALDEDLEISYQHFLAKGPQGDKNFSYATLEEALDIHPEISGAIQNGKAMAVSASSIDQILETSDTEQLARLLTQDIRDLPQSPRHELSGLLSSPFDRTAIMKSLSILKKIFESENSPIKNRRIVILLTEKGPFAEGQIMAHAGFQEKTAGKTEHGTIYLHLQTLLLALDSPELETGLKNLLKHENNDLLEKQHQLRPNSEDLSSIHHLWFALQRKIQEMRFMITTPISPSPRTVEFSKNTPDRAA